MTDHWQARSRWLPEEFEARGGIAVQLGAGGATVYVTGRTTRSGRSEMNRPETIEETAALAERAGCRGIAMQVQPDAWRYVTEVEDAGKPADVTGYR